MSDKEFNELREDIETLKRVRNEMEKNKVTDERAEKCKHASSLAKKLWQRVQRIEEEHPGFINYSLELGMAKMIRSRVGETLQPCDIIEASKCFKDRQKERDFWWPMVVKLVKEECAGE